MTYDPHRDAQDERPAAYQPERTAMNICLLLAAIAAFFSIATVWAPHQQFQCRDR